MNYDDELERARAKRSRKRTNGAAAGAENARASATHQANQTVQSANSARATYQIGRAHV